MFILPFYVVSLPGYASYVLIFPQYFRDFALLFPVRCLISLKAFSILFLILIVMKCHYYVPGIVFVFVFLEYWVGRMLIDMTWKRSFELNRFLYCWASFSDSLVCDVNL